MATIAENIKSMASLVAEVKKDFKLTENTVMRIVDMNFALAQSAGMPSLSGDEQLPSFEDGPEPLTAEQMRMFPDDIEAAVARWKDENPDAVEEAINNAEDEVLATTDHPLEN